MRIKVMVASNDPDLKRELEHKADFSGNKMEVLAWVTSGEAVFERFGEVNPRLVILDKSLDGLDAAACIAKIHERKIRCRILVIGPAEDFAFMRTLFGLKVSGYLTKPLQEEELNRELRTISEDVRRITLDAIDYDCAISMQSLYFWKLMFEDVDLSQDREFLNRTLECWFREGYYRVILLRIDQFQGGLPDFAKVDYYDDLHRIQQYIKASISQHIYEYCYEILYDFKFNGVMTVLNYNTDYDSVILSEFEQIIEDVYRFAMLNYGMTVTVCIGGAYDDIKKVRDSREEAYSASWARMKRGTGRILYYRKRYDSQELYREKLEILADNLKLTAETLDIDEFHHAIEQIFALPDFVLSDYKSRKYMLEFLDEFFRINSSVLSRHVGVNQEKEMIKKTLNFCNTFDSYQKNLQDRIDRLFELCVEDAEKKNIRQLRKTIKYIKENYDKSISLEELASMVNLSPIYFSYLFKKNVGMNMTDYITEYRMEMAKKMLFETDMNINEISCAIGFQDQRYFSKRFKQIVGKTPTEYRKMK